MRTPDHWYPPATGATPVQRLTALGLSPLAAFYDIAGWLRLALVSGFDPGVPVICIGNLTAGGTGKTPFVITIVRGLAAVGHRPHILTRGYGSRLKGPVRVDPARHTARDVGDEPLLLARSGPVWIARDRRAGAREAVKAGADMIVMDDGHQNPYVQKTLSIVIVDGEVGFGNARVIPAGPMRENTHRGLARADALVVMGQESSLTKGQLLSWQGPSFHAHLAPQPTTLSGTYLAFAGIGRPEKFFATLESTGAHIIERVSFADHHNYSDMETNDLLKRAAAAGARAITTAKDAVRLDPSHRSEIDVLDVAAVVAANEAFGPFLAERLASHTQQRHNAAQV